MIVRSTAKRTYNRVVNAGLDLLGRPALEKLGSDYGGWIVPTDRVERDWVCYSAGAGNDITFDLALIDRFGCVVHAFDPTELARAHTETAAAGEARLVFHPFGLWSSDGEVHFYEPRNPHMLSHSIVNLGRGSSYVALPVRRVSSVMRELGHDRLDLLKLDIEGAEYGVLASLFEDGIEPKVICLEIERPIPLAAGLDALRRLFARYRLVAVDGKNCTFVLR